MDIMRDMQARQRYEELETTLRTLTPEAAIAKISQFIQHFPDFPQAHNDLAVLLYQQGELLQTLGRFERAVRLAPRNRTFRKNLASFYFVELGWTDDAIFLYTGLLKEEQTDAEVLGALAMISSRIGRPDEAGHFLHKILDLEPWNNAARDMLNSLAAPIIPTVPVTPPTPAPAAAQGDVDTLLAGLRQTIAGMTAVSKTPEERYREALQLAEQGRAAEAVTALEDLVRSVPAYALAWNDLGVLTFQSGDLGRSLVAHEQALRLESANPTFGKNLANLYYAALGRTDDAIRIFTGILREQPNDVETLLALGQISAANGYAEQARTFVTKALQLEPWNAAAREFLCSI
ncbi:MAG: tetratricopeptide repeat protein [Steroidobacteraceae bacterium]|nr:tetratricopeptide repeat protein [Deltaproteobacteria bacterium]